MTPAPISIPPWCYCYAMRFAIALLIPLAALATSLRGGGPAKAGPHEPGGPYDLSQRGAAAGRTTARVVAAANTLLATLSDPQRTQATFAFNSPPRTGLHNPASGALRR